MLIQEKVRQAASILKELDVDCWLTVVRESAVQRDPLLDFFTRSDLTWLSAFLVTPERGSWALVGDLDRKSIEDLEVYDEVRSYTKDFTEPFQEMLRALNPSTIALNFSRTSEVCDGLSHGLFLKIRDLLEDLEFADRIQSAEKIGSRLAARKTASELARIRRAIGHTQEIFALVHEFLAPGQSELEVAAFMLQQVDRRELDLAWNRDHCPAVFTGPDTAGAHYHPTRRKIREGHILNMDFGVKFDGYCSDLQRTFYIREPGEAGAPPEVGKGFDTIRRAIEEAREAIRPGVTGSSVDRVARELITSEGYEEFPHALGHQVGRFAHDGTALLGPAWSKYADKPFEELEEGMVFTIEPRLTVPGRGVVTVEEMVAITAEGAHYLSEPQTELFLI